MSKSRLASLFVLALVAALLLASLPYSAVTASAAGPVTVTSGRAVSDVVGEKDPPLATLSPNGAQIAWYAETGRGQKRTGRICLYTFASAAKKCYDMPLGKFKGYPYQFAWSPDSKLIAFTENPIQMGYDADIWLFKVADGLYTNLTDDQVIGGWRYEAGKPVANVDYLPMWNRSDGQIYFWRLVPKGDGNYSLGLFRIAATGGGPAQVRDVTTAIPRSVPVFDYERFFMDGVSSLSPDGSQLAAVLATVDEMGASQPSLWLIDMKNTSAAPKQLMTAADFQKAIPIWSVFPAAPLGLSWTSDGKGIVALAYSFGDDQYPFMVFYYITPSGGAAKPVVDFSALPDFEDYYTPVAEGGLAWRAYSPWSASLSPKGDKLLMVNDLGGYAGLFNGTLPPDGKLPVIAASSSQSVGAGAATRSSRSADGKLIIYGILLTLEEK